MTDFGEIIGKIAGAAHAVAKLSPQVEGVIKAVETVSDLVLDAKTTLAANDEQVEQLADARAALERSVVDHAKRTSHSLEG